MSISCPSGRVSARVPISRRRVPPGSRQPVSITTYMPTGYDPAAEYDRLINGVAVDVAVERQVALKGLMRWHWHAI